MTQAQALDILKLGHNVYLTGSAGSGKTYLLNKYIEYLKKQGVAVGVTASTGIAATHLNGITIHSWSGLGIKDQLSKADLKDLAKKSYLKKRFRDTKVLIIDEISMLHGFQLDLIDRICRRFKENQQPFGGMQVIFCGDFFQLPPVGKKATFAMESDVWSQMGLKICYLHKQYRQSDDQLSFVLNSVRANQAGAEVLNCLRQRYQKTPEFSGRHITKLFTHNVDVDLINHRHLATLAGLAKRYMMRAAGREKLAQILKQSCLAPAELILKKGAVVMFVKNNFEAGYVNGTLGQVVGFDENNFPVVKVFKTRQKITAAPVSWVLEENGIPLAEITQIPLRLAWAITVHKSQGMSLDAVELDLSKSFEPGMGYVALSRARSLDGIKLMGLNEVALKVNENILEFDRQLKKESQKAIDELMGINESIKKQKQDNFLKAVSLTRAEKEKQIKKTPGATRIKTHKLAKKGLSIKEIARRRGLTEGTILSHLEELSRSGQAKNWTHLKPPVNRFNKIKKAFLESGDNRLSPVKKILGDEFSYDEIKLARIFFK